MDELDFFKIRKNRFCVFFLDYGFVPCAGAGDDVPIFETPPPRRIGDDAIVFVEGQRRMVRLLESYGHVKTGAYLVDMGPIRVRDPVKYEVRHVS